MLNENSDKPEIFNHPTTVQCFCYIRRRTRKRCHQSAATRYQHNNEHLCREFVTINVQFSSDANNTAWRRDWRLFVSLQWGRVAGYNIPQARERAVRCCLSPSSVAGDIQSVLTTLPSTIVCRKPSQCHLINPEVPWQSLWRRSFATNRIDRAY